MHRKVPQQTRTLRHLVATNLRNPVEKHVQKNPNGRLVVKLDFALKLATIEISIQEQAITIHLWERGFD